MVIRFFKQSCPTRRNISANCTYSVSNAVYWHSSPERLRPAANTNKPGLQEVLDPTNSAQAGSMTDLAGEHMLPFDSKINNLDTLVFHVPLNDIDQLETMPLLPKPQSHVTEESSTRFECTFDGCEHKTKVFFGRGAKTAFGYVTCLKYTVPRLMILRRRHMDSHERPHTCPHPSCNRHTKGFSRKDNLKNHIEKLHPTPNPKDSERLNGGNNIERTQGIASHSISNRSTFRTHIEGMNTKISNHKVTKRRTVKKRDSSSRSARHEFIRAELQRIEMKMLKLKKERKVIQAMMEDSDDDDDEEMTDDSNVDEDEDDKTE
jgi:hypothetical protein